MEAGVNTQTRKPLKTKKVPGRWPGATGPRVFGQPGACAQTAERCLTPAVSFFKKKIGQNF